MHRLQVKRYLSLVGIAALAFQGCARSKPSPKDPKVAAAFRVDLTPTPTLIVTPFPVNLPISIETGADNGFLDCVAQKFTGSPTHANTKQAFGNLAYTPASAGGVVLVGHGTAGLICTGDGSSCAGPSKVVRQSNNNVWDSIAAKLKGRSGRLYLVACDTGAEDDGQTLLKRLATATGMDVTAPNAHVWCNDAGITLDPGAVWNTATPTGVVTYRQRRYMKGKGMGRLWSGSRMESIDDGALRFSDLRIVTSDADGTGTQSRTDEQARQVGTRIDFGSAFLGPGVPGAVITATLHVTAVLPGDRRLDWDFNIYSDDLAQDQQNPRMFYRIDSAGTETLRGFSR